MKRKKIERKGIMEVETGGENKNWKRERDEERKDFEQSKGLTERER